MVSAGSNDPLASQIAKLPASPSTATAPSQRALLLVGAALLHDRHELGDGRQQRTGRDHAAELLGEDRGLDRAEPDAAVLLRRS